MTAPSQTVTPGTVWDGLVGQPRVIEALRAAAAGHGMSHAFLFTGPPGSGRSNAAIAFAAALQCERGRGSGPADGGRASRATEERGRDRRVETEDPPGCGVCHACHTVLAGSHADVAVVRTEGLSIGIKQVRELVRRSALTPIGNRWQIVIVEDADRLTEHAFNALLKAIEEPAERTVWMLCAPTVEDVLPTIRSRCRLVSLTTPTTDEVAAFLVRRDGVDTALAAYAARASQGHIGRARALARDEETRNRRRAVVEIPATLISLGRCMAAAAQLTQVTKEEAEAITAELDAREKAELDAAYGVEQRGRRPREYAPALRDLEVEQNRRAKRRRLDVVDRGLMDLVSVYRDAIAVAAGASGALVNEEIRGDVELLARASGAEANLRRISAVFEAREQMLEFNVPPALALESMMLGLVAPEVRR